VGLEIQRVHLQKKASVWMLEQHGIGYENAEVMEMDVDMKPGEIWGIDLHMGFL
jgi:hypothetical protein